MLKPKSIVSSVRAKFSSQPPQEAGSSVPFLLTDLPAPVLKSPDVASMLIGYDLDFHLTSPLSRSIFRCAQLWNLVAPSPYQDSYFCFERFTPVQAAVTLAQARVVTHTQARVVTLA